VKQRPADNDLAELLPGPVGESNLYRTAPRGEVLLMPQTREGLSRMLDAVVATRNTPVVDGKIVGAAVARELAPLALNAGYELGLNAPDAPVTIRGDEGSLTRALANVVQNAIVHAANHGQIVVEVSTNGTISVMDDGPGIAPADRERIFEPFYRIKPLATGAGLGLNLVASIVQRHKGRVAVTESSTGGAKFSMTLPLAEG
jgi:signal transduction histidine kinase